MKRQANFPLFFVALFFTVSVEAANWDWVKGALPSVTSAKLSDTKIGAGLKEALKVGAQNTIKFLGKTNGYFGNSAVKILMPQAIQKAEPVLRQVGLGPKIDEFILSMNRAAEKAAPLAAEAFSTAITEMSLDDATKILEGGNTAATDYLKSKTYPALLQKFQPAVENAMKDYAVTKKFEEITGQLKTMPLFKALGNVDINKYVASKALDGLFYTLGKEEGKIRTDPAARVTDVLKEVFKSPAK